MLWNCSSWGLTQKSAQYFTRLRFWYLVHEFDPTAKVFEVGQFVSHELFDVLFCWMPSRFWHYEGFRNLTRFLVWDSNNSGVIDVRMGQEKRFELCWSDLAKSLISWTIQMNLTCGRIRAKEALNK